MILLVLYFLLVVIVIVKGEGEGESKALTSKSSFFYKLNKTLGFVQEHQPVLNGFQSRPKANKTLQFLTTFLHLAARPW